MTDIEIMSAAYDAGAARAAQMVPGVKFLGAMPEAIAAGFNQGSLGYRGFQRGFLDNLPLRVVTDADGVIIAD